jgi:hypothetical protein
MARGDEHFLTPENSSPNIGQFLIRGDENDKPRSTIAEQDGAAVGIAGVVVSLLELARSYLAVAVFGVAR